MVKFWREYTTHLLTNACQNNLVPWQNARSMMLIVTYWLSHLYPQNCNHPIFFPPSFSSFASPLPDTNFSVLITSILFLVCRSNDRHFYQRWFIGYQSIRHCWWVDRNWLVLVTLLLCSCASISVPYWRWCLFTKGEWRERSAMRLEREDISEKAPGLK